MSYYKMYDVEENSFNGKDNQPVKGYMMMFGAYTDTGHCTAVHRKFVSKQRFDNAKLQVGDTFYIGFDLNAKITDLRKMIV